MRRFVLLLTGFAVLLASVVVGGGTQGEARATPALVRCVWKPTLVPRLSDAASLSAVSASAANDVWIVGYSGWVAGGMVENLPMITPARPLVLHYDGHTLRTMPAPSLFPKGSWLNDVVALGPKDVWAIGEGLTRTEPVNHYVPLALHYDGQRWSRVSMPTIASKFGVELYGVAGLAGNDLWAVGQAYSARRGEWVGLIERWDGTRWRIVPSSGGAYRTVTAISGTDVWAAGEQPVRWNGTTWKLVRDTSRPGWHTFAYGSSASGRKNLWIVGNEAAAPFVERFDGRRFVRFPVPAAHWKSNEEDSSLGGVTAISARDVWAVGNFGIEHFTGRQWSLVSRDSAYVGITATSRTDIWAVGSVLKVTGAGPAAVAKVLRYSCSG